MTHKVPVSTAMSRIHFAFIIEATDWIMSHSKREIKYAASYKVLREHFGTREYRCVHACGEIDVAGAWSEC